MDRGDLSDEENRAVAVRVREALAQKRMSRQRLADEAGVSVSTLEKALAGGRPFTLATLVRLEQALGKPLRSAKAQDTAAMPASADLGAYGREAADWLVGSYLTIRASFEKPDVLYTYLTEIFWDEAARHLAFREQARLDAAFSQRGAISLPHQSGHVYLMTNDRGQFRLVTLSRPTIGGDMYGLLSTLQAERGGRLIPVATPIALVKEADPASAAFGQIDRSNARYALYRGHLDKVVGEDFARIVHLASASEG